MNDIASRIVWVRKSLKMNQNQFAYALGIKQATVSAYEVGRNTPEHRTMVRIAKLGNVTLDWLLTGSETSSPTGGTGNIDNSGQSEMVLVHNVSNRSTVVVSDKNITDEVCKSCDTRKMLEMQIEALKGQIEALKTSNKDKDLLIEIYKRSVQ